MTQQVPTSVSNSDSGGVPRVGGDRGGGAAGTQKAGGRPRGAGRRSRRRRPRGEEPSPGAPHRPGLLERPVWWPGRGAAGRESRAGQRGPGSCLTRLVTGPRRPAPTSGLRCGRAASTPHTARRRGNGWNSSRGASLRPGAGGAGRTPEGACAGAARRGGGGPAHLPSQAPARGEGAPLGALPGLKEGHGPGPRREALERPSLLPRQPVSGSGCAGGGGHVGRGTAPLLSRHRAPSLWGGWQRTTHTQAWAPVQGRAEALRNEASASPSLHFGKALA